MTSHLGPHDVAAGTPDGTSGSDEPLAPACDTVTVRVRFFAAARAAAGTDSEQLSLAANTSVADAVHALHERFPAELGRILTAASFLLDGVAVRDRSTTLPADTELDVLPPFAGG